MEEDALVPDLADDDEVVELPAARARKGCSELHEHAATVVFRRHHEHGIRREDGVEVVGSQPGGVGGT